MTYRVSYDEGSVAATGSLGHVEVTRTEYFLTEFEALRRARQLLEDGDSHRVAVHDGSGHVIAGIRLQLKLGVQVVD